MQPNSTFGYEQIVTELIRGVIDTVTDKPGLTPERRATVTQTVVSSVMGFNPRDPVETMIAGQCIVYDHMFRQAALDILRHQSDLVTTQARASALACGKTFLAAVAMMLRMKRRPQAELAFARQQPAAPVAKPQPATPAETPPIAAKAGTHPIAATEIAAPIEPRAQLAADAPLPSPVAHRAAAAFNGNSLTGRAASGLALPAAAQTILFDGIDPRLKQEIMEAAARPVR